MKTFNKVEYSVRQHVRYSVHRYEEGAELTERGESSFGGTSTKGEYDNADVAYEVGYALAKAEHDQLGWPPGDERIIYPRHPNDPNVEAAA